MDRLIRDAAMAQELFGDDSLERYAAGSHRVLRDGDELFRGTEDECFHYLHSHTPFSVHEATTRQGYRIEAVQS